MSITSSTVRPIGPAERMVDGAVCGMRPWVGLSATSPQCPAGSRTDPAMSVPTDEKPMPAASDAPAPALEPPVFRDGIPRIAGDAV